MRKKIAFRTLVVLFFLVIRKESTAQGLWLGAKAGVSIPNLSAGGSDNNPLNTGYRSRLGANVALSAEFTISPLFSLEAMAEYSSQGGKKDGLQAFPTPSAVSVLFPPNETPTYLYANFNSEAKLDYLMIPILGKFGWNLGHKSPWRVYVDAGPFASFLLNSKQITSGFGKVYLDPAGTEPLTNPYTNSAVEQSFDSTQSLNSQIHRVNFGLEGNIGISFTLGSNRLFIEGGGNYGFLNIQKGTANGKNQVGAGTVRIGYAHKL